MSLYMVFDVESVGLHGPAFAYGWVVVDEKGTRQASGLEWTDPSFFESVCSPEDFAWVQSNCDFINDPFSPSPCEVPRGLTDRFWEQWTWWRDAGALLCADVPWPVEANFLTQCMVDHPHDPPREGPYPLIDIASVRLAVGLDPLGEEERLQDELPKHNPLADARQSARLLIEALRIHGKG